MKRVVGHYRDRGIGAQQLSHPAGVDHHVGAGLAEQRGEHRPLVRRCRAVARRVDQHEQLAATVQIDAQRLDLARQEVGLRPGDDHGSGVFGYGALLREHEGLDVEIIEPKGAGNGGVAVAVGAGVLLLAVAFDEVHRLLHALDHRDQAVG